MGDGGRSTGSGRKKEKFNFAELGKGGRKV